MSILDVLKISLDIGRDCCPHRVVLASGQGDYLISLSTLTNEPPPKVVSGATGVNTSAQGACIVGTITHKAVGAPGLQCSECCPPCRQHISLRTVIPDLEPFLYKLFANRTELESVVQDELRLQYWRLHRCYQPCQKDSEGIYRRAEPAPTNC